MIQFMDETYKKYGGSDSVGYNKYLRQNLKDLKAENSLAELEMAKNAFNPDKSRYLSSNDRDVANSLLEDSLVSSRYLTESTRRTLDLSTQIESFIKEQKLRRSRNEELGMKVHNIVSILNDSGMDSQKLQNVSTMLLDDVKDDKIKEPKTKREATSTLKSKLKPIKELKTKDKKSKSIKEDKKEKVETSKSKDKPKKLVSKGKESPKKISSKSKDKKAGVSKPKRPLALKSRETKPKLKRVK